MLRFVANKRVGGMKSETRMKTRNCIPPFAHYMYINMTYLCLKFLTLKLHTTYKVYKRDTNKTLNLIVLVIETLIIYPKQQDISSNQLS